MASILSAGTTSATSLNLSADTSGVLQLASNNGTVGMTMDTSQNVGIGTSSPGAKLAISGAVAGGGNIGLSITDTTASLNVQLIRTGPTFSYAGVGANEAWLFPQGTSNLSLGPDGAGAVKFVTNGSERARFNSTGAFVLAGGTTTADGIGITFPATQSASSNANTLDDYEEGTWTPAITFGGGSTGVTYTASNGGFYTKVGRLVTLTFILDVSNKGSSTGNAIINGAPFNCINAQSGRGGLAIGFTSGLTINNPNVMFTAGTSQMAYRTPNGLDLDNSSFSTSFSTYGSYSYFI